jgi:hypothetical protein
VEGVAVPSLFSLVLRECRVRRVGFGLTLLAVAAGVGVLTGALAALNAYDRETDATLRQQLEAMQDGLRRYDDDLRQAMRHLGFNLVLLPAEQSLADFHAEGYAAATMPEANVQRLAETGLLTAEQFVPVLRRKVRWEERGWTVLVQGWGPGAGSATAAGVAAPPRGMVDLGYELQRGLNPQPGERVSFLGADFALRACRPEVGTHDDITVWMDLRDAQELLDLPGRISEIRALSCRTAWDRLSAVRAEIGTVLPGVVVIEERGETVTLAAARAAFESGQEELLGDLRLAREVQRQVRLRLAQAVSGLVLVLAAGVSSAMAWLNARARRVEVALWAALGASAAQVYALFVWRGILAAVLAAVLGLAGGCPWWGWPGGVRLAAWACIGLAAALAAVVPASLVATALALRCDPAEVLKNDS